MSARPVLKYPPALFTTVTIVLGMRPCPCHAEINLTVGSLFGKKIKIICLFHASEHVDHFKAFWKIPIFFLFFFCLTPSHNSS